MINYETISDVADIETERQQHPDGVEFVEAIARYLSQTGIMPTDSNILHFIRTMSANEYKDFGINTNRINQA